MRRSSRLAGFVILAKAPPLRFHAEAAEVLVRAAWPENLRGLNRLVHELATLRTDEPIRIDALPTWVKDAAR